MRVVKAVRNAPTWASATLVVSGESAKDTTVVGQSVIETTLATFPMAVVPVMASLLYGATVLTALSAIGVVVMGESTKGRLVIGLLVATLVAMGTVVMGTSLTLTAGDPMLPTGAWLDEGESFTPVATVLTDGCCCCWSCMACRACWHACRAEAREAMVWASDW